MSKQEFLDTLRRALARELSEGEVADNINYYWNYIEQEIAFGKSEEQVLSELGDPRLIARTILQVDEQREEDETGRSFGYQEEVFTANPDGSYDADSGTQNDPYSGNDFHGSVHMHKLTVTDWIKIALVLIIIFLVLGTIFRILWKLLPFFIVVAVILWVYRRITDR